MNNNREAIITLTVNPAQDLHVRIREGREEILRRDAGGKGINVSRALFAADTDSLCMLVLGEQSEDSFIPPLAREGLRLDWVTVRGSVRENKNLQEGDVERVLRGTGPRVDGRAVERLRARLLPSVGEGTYLAFSGRISDGSDKGAILSLLREARDRGARLLLDSVSLNAEDIKALKPYMIKPNLEEAEFLLNRPLSETDAEGACRELLSLGVGYVLLTLGSNGIILATSGGVYRKSGVRLDPVSTTGAGDSALAGFLAAKVRGMNDTDTLRLSLAFATAACLAEGSTAPDPCRIKEIFINN